MTTQELIETIQDYFGDTGRSPEETKAGLEEAASIIELQIGAIDEQADE